MTQRQRRDAGAERRAQRILARIRAIPAGTVQTYGDIEPSAPRLVGRVLATTTADVPWHRVVRADGSVAKGERQREILRREGVPFRGDRVDFRTLRGGDRGRRRLAHPRTVSWSQPRKQHEVSTPP